MLKMEQDGTVVCNGKFEHFSSSEYIFEIIPSEIKKAVKLQSVKYPKMYLAICFERVFGTVSIINVEKIYTYSTGLEILTAVTRLTPKALVYIAINPRQPVL